jgi:DNA-binding SARP family transcriptional activator/TolB-like protein/lipopolysaccharide biosynthesis regulator YciM
MVEFRVLGPVELTSEDGVAVHSVLSQPKRLGILAYLAVATPRGFHRRDALLALFWPDLDETHARGALSQALHRLRQSLGEELLAGRRDEEVGLEWSRWRCDAVEFRAALAAGRLEEAVALYRGELLAGVAAEGSARLEHWLDAQRSTFRSEALEAALTLARRDAAAGQLEAALAWFRRARQVDPADPDPLLELMRLLQRAGTPRAALAEYEAYASALQADLELAPPESLAAYAARVRAALDAEVAAEPVAGAATLEAGAGGEPAGVRRRSRPARAVGALPGGRSAAVGALGAVVVLAFAAAAGWGVRQNGGLAARGELDVAKQIVLADFVNRTAEEHLADAVTEALRVDMGQSRFISLLASSRLPEALSRMSLSATSRLTAEVARELAVREGLEAVLTGEVAAVGTGYVISAQLITADSGRVLLSRRENARGPDDVVAAVDRLSSWLRRRMGESLGELRRSEPLEAVTTSSLEALKAYSAALRILKEDPARTFDLLERAIELDSMFAAAHVKLGVMRYWYGGIPRWQREQLMTRGYELRHRLTERERLHAEGVYLHYITLDWDRAIQVFEQMLERDPRDYVPLDHLALLYFRRKDFERSIRMSEQLGTSSQLYLFALLAAGRFQQAEALVDGKIADDSTRLEGLTLRAWLRAQQGDYAAADAIARDVVRLAEESRSWQLAGARGNLAYIAMLRGSYAEGKALLRAARSVRTPRLSPADKLGLACDIGMYDALVLRDWERARAGLDAAVAQAHRDSLPLAEWPYARLADSYAHLGDTTPAAAFLREHDKAYRSQYTRDVPAAAAARALLHAYRGQIAAANEVLEAARPGLNARALLPAQALVYEAAAMPDSALAAWEAYVTTPFPTMFGFPAWLAHAIQRTAELYDEKGDERRANEYYGQLVALWQAPDPELRPRLEYALDRSRRNRE